MPDNNDRGDQTPSAWSDDDARALQGFLIQVRELLEAIVIDKRHVPEELLPDVAAAWPDARSDLDRLYQALDPVTLSDSPERRAALRAHGLTGSSLRMKLSAWRERYFRFGHRMDRPWLRSVLRWSDTILESLGDAIPGGGAAQEFKQSVENFLDDAEADDVARPKKGSRK